MKQDDKDPYYVVFTWVGGEHSLHSMINWLRDNGYAPFGHYKIPHYFLLENDDSIAAKYMWGIDVPEVVFEETTRVPRQPDRNMYRLSFLKSRKQIIDLAMTWKLAHK